MNGWNKPVEIEAVDLRRYFTGKEVTIALLKARAAGLTDPELSLAWRDLRIGQVNPDTEVKMQWRGVAISMHGELGELVFGETWLASRLAIWLAPVDSLAVVPSVAEHFAKDLLSPSTINMLYAL